MEINITEICNITEMAYRTVKRRIEGLEPVREDGKNQFYNSHQALQAVYSKPFTQEDNLDLAKERAKLAAAQTEKINIEIKKMKDELVDREEVLEEYNRDVLDLRNKLMNMSVSLSSELAKTNESEEVYKIINKYIHKTLTDVARENGV